MVGDRGFEPPTPSCHDQSASNRRIEPELPREWVSSAVNVFSQLAGSTALPTFHSLTVGPILVAHVILIHIKRLTYDLRAFIVAHLPSFTVRPILIAYIILIHVKRFTNDFRAAFVTLLRNIRPIVLLWLMAT